MNGGSTNLDISGLTTGVSKEGLQNYIDELKTNVLLDVSREIDNVDELVNAINNCWQGESRDRFLENFAQMREMIKNDLTLEHSNLESKLQSLFDQMYYLDRFGIYDYK